MTTDEELASPRPWTYHSAPSRHGIAGLQRDWIEDASGNTILENVGCLDGPLICRAVNALYEDQQTERQPVAGLDTLVAR
jgi:hypothetical protein